jgi:hypothetical protein
VRHLLGVTPPDWNSGITLRTPGTGDSGLPDEPPPYGFFESDADTSPPFWWW